MKVIIAGSRSITSLPEEALSLLSSLPITHIISGTARGADRLGEEYARAHSLPIIYMPAEWKRYGRSAGYRRNAEMAKEADAAVIIWDGSSSGTRHMISLASRYSLPTYLFTP